MTSTLTVEFHCHTHRSRDSRMDPQRLLEVARRRQIDRVAITDHNTIAGAREAQAIDPQMVIVGEEILTTQGELLAYFVEDEVPSGLDPREAIRRLRDQGAVISVSHPYDRTRSGAWEEGDLLAILPLVDAIEVFNSRTWTQRPNQHARDLARREGIAGTAGSDAHTYSEVGRTVVRLAEFHGAAGLRSALPSARILARPSLPWVHLLSTYASMRRRI